MNKECWIAIVIGIQSIILVSLLADKFCSVLVADCIENVMFMWLGMVMIHYGRKK